MEYKEKVNNWLKQNKSFTKSNSDITTHPTAANAYPNTSYAERVKHWLASNKHTGNRKIILPGNNAVPENHTNTTIKTISPTTLKATAGNDIDSLHSVDTAKYILSNNKKTKTRITRMTIKEYCHLSSSNNKYINRSRSVDDGFVKRVSSSDNVPVKVKTIRRNIQTASSTDSSEKCGGDLKCTQKHQKRYRRICHRKQSFDQRSKFLSIVSELRKRSNSDDDDDEPADGLNALTDASSCTKRLRRCNFVGKKNLKS